MLLGMASADPRPDPMNRPVLPARGTSVDPVGLAWLITVRWTTLAAGVGAVIAGRSGLGARMPVGLAGLLLAMLAVSNLWLMWAVRRVRTKPVMTMAGMLVCADVVLLTWLLIRSGGVLNPVSVFYLVEIVMAALVLGRSWTWIVTTLSVGGYATLFMSPPADLRAAQVMHPEIAVHMRGMWLAFALTSVIVGILVTRLAVAVERRDRALEALRDRSARASRFAGLATLAAGAAHELSTPLATIAVAAHELERSLDLREADADLRGDATLIRGEIDRCRRVLDEMAGRIAEPSGEAPRHASVADVIEHALSGLTPEERARVRVRMARALPVVWPIRVVGQAVANVVKNGLQASSPTDEIQLDIGEMAGARVRIVVVDQGQGMTPDEVARAGEPFFTTKPQGVGTGLGLFVARSTVEQLGGSLALASVPGAGTTATLVLPADVVGK